MAVAAGAAAGAATERDPGGSVAGWGLDGEDVGGGGAVSRIDVHLHFHASGAASNWWVKRLGLGLETRESYTAPGEAYRLAKAAGMDFVTLTDHEAIAGALTLAGRADFLVGEEVNAVFPEDGTTVDVLVYGVGADAHAELQARRGDVRALVAFLREAGLVHVLAHPMFATGEGGELSREKIEWRMALFGLWEFVNGSRPAEQNRLTAEAAASVDAASLRQIAAKRGLPAPPHRRIAGVGGSDDHGGIYPGATHTLLPRVGSIADLLEAMRLGAVRPAGEDGSPEKMAHTGFKIAGIAYGNGGRGEPGAAQALAQGVAQGAVANLSRELARRSPLGKLFPASARSLGAEAQPAQQLLEYLPFAARMSGPQIWSALVARYEGWVAGALRGVGGEGGAGGFPVLGLLGSLGRFVDGHLLIAPYVGIHGYFGRETQKARALRHGLFPERRRPLRVGVFVDDLGSIHGVATMYANVGRVERCALRPIYRHHPSFGQALFRGEDSVLARDLDGDDGALGELEDGDRRFQGRLGVREDTRLQTLRVDPFAIARPGSGTGLPAIVLDADEQDRRVVGGGEVRQADDGLDDLCLRERLRPFTLELDGHRLATSDQLSCPTLVHLRPTRSADFDIICIPPHSTFGQEAADSPPTSAGR